MNPHYRSFDKIKKDGLKINLGRFSKIVYDLGFKIIPQRKLTEIFKKVCKGDTLMGLPLFVDAMEETFVGLRDFRK